MKKFNKILLLQPKFFFSNVSMLGCIWVTVAISLQRYFAITFPLKNGVLSYRQRKTLLASISILAFLFDFPRLFELEMTNCIQKNRLLPRIKRTELYKNPDYFVTYRIVLGAIFVHLGPFLVLLVFSSLLIAQMHLRPSMHIADGSRRRLVELR